VPDVAIEVIVTHASIDKLEVYRGLGVREVWLFESGAFRVLALKGGVYAPIAASEIFPEIDLTRIAEYAVKDDQHAAVVAFRAELCGS
jgi:Uma2 family endonuclease